MADIRCARNIVVVDPLTVRAGYDALCTQNIAVLIGILECLECALDFLDSVLSCRLGTPALEYLVCMMMMLVIVVMIVASAGAVLVMLVMMMLMFLMIVVMVMMMMLMLLMIVVMVVMVVLMLLMIVVMIMMMMLVLLVLMIVMMVMIVMGCLLKESCQLIVNGVLLGHGIGELLAGELIPICGNDRRLGVLLAQALDNVVKLVLGKTLCMGKNQAGCIGDLVIEEFTEILLVHLALLGIDNGCEAVELHIVHLQILYGTDNVGKLADTGRLDEDSVRMILLKNLLKCLTEIAYERAADAAGIR